MSETLDMSEKQKCMMAVAESVGLERFALMAAGMDDAVIGLTTNNAELRKAIVEWIGKANDAEAALAAEKQRADEATERVKTVSDTFDAIWNVCVECGMVVHPPQLEPDEFGETCEEEYAYQFEFIRDLAAKSRELHRIRLGVATLVERFHHWGQSDGDMGWAKGMREASEELSALLSPQEPTKAKLPHPELAYKAVMARSEQLKQEPTDAR